MKYEDILAWWKKEKKDTKEDIYTLLDNFKILFAYHSGKIENETITLHDTREIIHPFADGNGRVGRTLLNYYLMTHGYPPLVLYSEDKKTYYLALSVFDETGQIEGFKEFLKEQMIKTWEKKKRVPVNLNMFL